jgi:CubicO group peptidase (beta-lactamase class C family)
MTCGAATSWVQADRARSSLARHTGYRGAKNVRQEYESSHDFNREINVECFAALSIAVVAVTVLAVDTQLEAEQTMVFPGEQWELASAESQGIDAEKLDEAVRWLHGNVPRDGVKRLVIVRNGRMIWRGREADRRQRMWSVTKAFTSTAQGLLTDDGKCTLDTLAKKYRPKLARHYPTVTLRHLATMTSGIDGVGGSYDCDAQGRCDANA